MSTKNLTRQLNKDLPRCHRYHQIMKLPEMQSLIQRIIASWILGNKHRIYSISKCGNKMIKK